MESLAKDNETPEFTNNFQYGEYKKWILHEFKKRKVNPNEDIPLSIWFISTEKNNILWKLFKECRRKEGTATVNTFTTLLAQEMMSMQEIHQKFKLALIQLEEKSEHLLQLYRNFEQVSKEKSLPTVTRVLCRPTALNTPQRGKYSIDFHFGKKNMIVASNIAIDDPAVEVPILDKPQFDCQSPNLKEPLGVVLYNERDQELAANRLLPFDEFWQTEFSSEERFFLNPITINIPLLNSEEDIVAYAAIEMEFAVTLQMLETITSNAKLTLSFQVEKLNKNISSLQENIFAITHAFPEIQFARSRSLFYSEMDTSGVREDSFDMPESATASVPQKGAENRDCCCNII